MRLLIVFVIVTLQLAIALSVRPERAPLGYIITSYPVL
jgi:hypothetical protein